MLDNAFNITLLFVIASTLVVIISKRLHRDKCLKDFEGFMVTLGKKSGKNIWGNLRVENTGIELVYSESIKDSKGHVESSYIVYKFEFENIHVIARFHDNLSEEHKVIRQKDLKRTYHPGFFRKARRRLINLVKTIRDAVTEIMNLLINKAHQAKSFGSTLKSQDKYVNKIKSELIDSVGTSYEPLLERYIGHKVVLEIITGDRIDEYPGVLKDYTADFIEIMDVAYKCRGQEEKRTADLVVPRKHAIIRHLAE